VNILDGASCLFWEDLWNNRVPKLQYPELYSFVNNKDISLKSVMEAQGPAELFHLPISDVAHQQLISLAEDQATIQDSMEFDYWSYIWGSSFFSSAKAYTHLTGYRVIHLAFKWLRKSACQNKHKVFFWLLLKDRLSTSALLCRRNMNLPDYTCVTCPAYIEESLEHLFIHCPFAQSCWAAIGVQIGFELFATLERLKLHLGVPFFMEIIILMSWCIWMQRNDFIFKGIQPSQVSCLQHFKKEFILVILRAKTKYKTTMNLWLEALV